MYGDKLQEKTFDLDEQTWKNIKKDKTFFSDVFIGISWFSFRLWFEEGMEENHPEMKRKIIFPKLHDFGFHVSFWECRKKLPLFGGELQFELWQIV